MTKALERSRRVGRVQAAEDENHYHESSSNELDGLQEDGRPINKKEVRINQ